TAPPIDRRTDDACTERPSWVASSRLMVMVVMGSSFPGDGMVDEESLRAATKWLTEPDEAGRVMPLSVPRHRGATGPRPRAGSRRDTDTTAVPRRSADPPATDRATTASPAATDRRPGRRRSPGRPAAPGR